MSYQFSIKAMLTAFSASNKRQFAHDRTKSVGGSDVGQCIRKTWLTKRLGHHTFTPDDDYLESSGATDRGSVYENEVWAPAMKAHRPEGSKLLFAGEQQETLHVGQLSATPDGLFINLARDCLAHLGIPDIGPQTDSADEALGCLVVECKTIDPRVNLKGEPKPEHQFQKQVQMGVIRANTRYRPRFAIISYTNASFLDDVQEFVTEWNPKVFKAAEVRARQIFEVNDPSTLKPEGKLSGGKECNYCCFKRACAIISVEAMPEKDAKGVRLAPDLEKDFEAVAQLAKAYGDQEKSAEASKKEAQERVKQILREAGTRKYEFPSGLKISWSSAIGRENFDTKAMVEAVKDGSAAAKSLLAQAERAGVDVRPFRGVVDIDPEQFTKTGVPSDRLAITPPKG